jgi:thiol-disulfide isomerase/thioredoxin
MYKLFIVLFIFVMVGVIGIVMQIKPKKEGKDKVCDLIYFYTSWCPYCKRARVEWDKVKKEWNGKVNNGYTMYFKEMDCDANEAECTRYNITKYPTIKLVKDDMVVDFDANPTIDSLTRFIHASF